MDPFKRGPNGLRRIFRAHARLPPDDPRRPGGGIRELVSPSDEGSVRTLLQRTVATFVPPQLPLADPYASCSQLIAVLTHTTGPLGGLQLVAEVSTHLSTKVAFFLGFATNVDEYWACMAGGLNFGEEAREERGVLAKGNSGLFWGTGASAWLGRDFAKAREHGVTFRLLATDNMDSDPRNLLKWWMEKFGKPLGPPMGTKDLSEPEEWAAQPGLDLDVDEGAGDEVSFTVRLIFE